MLQVALWATQMANWDADKTSPDKRTKIKRSDRKEDEVIGFFPEVVMNWKSQKFFIVLCFLVSWTNLSEASTMGQQGDMARIKWLGMLLKSCWPDLGWHTGSQANGSSLFRSFWKLLGVAFVVLCVLLQPKQHFKIQGWFELRPCQIARVPTQVPLPLKQKARPFLTANQDTISQVKELFSRRKSRRLNCN